MRLLTDLEWHNLESRLKGPWLYGVLTTGIYCKAGCPARLPLRRNVRLIETLQEGRMAGLRACKRCKPDLLDG